MKEKYFNLNKKISHSKRTKKVTNLLTEKSISIQIAINRMVDVT